MFFGSQLLNDRPPLFLFLTMKKPAAKKAPVAMVRPAAAKGQQTLHDQSEVALAELDRFFSKGAVEKF